MHTTDTIVLVEPICFQLNHDAADNGFIYFDSAISNPQLKALQEHKNMVHMLRNKGIEVIVYPDTPWPHTPDSIFPNNVMTTFADGTVSFAAMKPENRHLEVSKQKEWLPLLEQKGYEITRIRDYSYFREQGEYLESTGSLILDRKYRIAYACLSERTTPTLLQLWGAENNYEIVSFFAEQKNIETGRLLPVYHTNIVMSVGTNFVAICLESISQKSDKEKLLDSFAKTHKEVIELTPQQFYHCAGNILEVKNTQGTPFVVMSQAACCSLHDTQKEKLQELGGEILAPDIATIEEIGGGSVRCMMLEIFLPKRAGQARK